VRMETGEDRASLKVDFPEGDPMEFSTEEDAGAYTDAILAGDVLIPFKVAAGRRAREGAGDGARQGGKESDGA